MKFVFPCKEYEQNAIAFIQEFYDHGSSVYGSGGLDRYLKEQTYTEWLCKVHADLDIANIPEGRVPAWTYFYVDEASEEIVGMINLRFALTDFLKQEGGHIGYCIRPTARRRGYGAEMLRGALAFARMVGLTEVIVSCDKVNLASAGVIKNCGGALETEFYSETFGEVIQCYRIR